MPELPEVESLRQKLEPVLLEKSFSCFSLFHKKSFQGNFDQIKDIVITQVNRRAKMLDFVFANSFRLVTHLKMTGQLIYVSSKKRFGGGHPTADWIQSLPSSHTRIEYVMNDGAKLFFNDQRIFGWMKVLSDEHYQKMVSKLGPDINDPHLTSEYLIEKLKRRTIPIKQAIMNNSIICGVGNIYACDALHLARISPFKSAQSLSVFEIEKLYQAMRRVIDRGIALGGTTFDGMYVDIDGFAGNYQNELRVYGQEGTPCPNCGHPILKKKLAGRGTYYCVHCQQ